MLNSIYSVVTGTKEILYLDYTLTFIYTKNKVVEITVLFCYSFTYKAILHIIDTSPCKIDHIRSVLIYRLRQ